MGLLLSVYLLSAITQTNKETIHFFNDIQAPGLHIAQDHNIYNNNDDDNINHNSYLHKDFVHNVRR